MTFLVFDEDEGFDFDEDDDGCGLLEEAGPGFLCSEAFLVFFALASFDFFFGRSSSSSSSSSSNPLTLV